MIRVSMTALLTDEARSACHCPAEAFLAAAVLATSVFGGEARIPDDSP